MTVAPAFRLSDLCGSLPLFDGIDGARRAALVDGATVVGFRADEVVIAAGAPGRTLYVLLDGRLRAGDRDGAPERSIERAGALVGAVEVFGGGEAVGSVFAAGPSRLLAIPATIVSTWADRAPDLYRRIAADVVRRLRARALRAALTGLFGEVSDADATALLEASTWRVLDPGEVLVRRGDPCAGLHLVVSGMLRSSAPSGRGDLTVGAGQPIGAAALLAGVAHPMTFSADRAAVVCLLPPDTVARRMKADTGIQTRLIASLADRLAGGTSAPVAHRIVVGGASPAVPAGRYTRGLLDALGGQGTTIYVDRRVACETLGLPERALRGSEGPGWPRLRAWVDALNRRADVVVFGVDERHPDWSRFCRMQADVAVVFADPTQPVSACEDALLGDADHPARRLVVLVHPDDAALPTGTRDRLDRLNQPDVLHLRGAAGPEIRRLARHVLDRRIGLVLGGGNALSLAHLGVLRALAEAGVPVDCVGGTSFGAIIAGVSAMRLPWSQVRALGQDLIDLRPFRSLTLPRTGLLKAGPFDWIAQRAFGENRIEDLWLDMYCVSVDLTARREAVHDRGALWRAVRASGSLPALIEPHVEDGHIHVDGGLLNNVPIDEMRRRTQGPIIAVDVSPMRPLRAELDRRPVRWWRRDRAERVRAPGIVDVLVRSMSVTSAMRTERERGAVDLFIEPDLDPIGSTRFDQMDTLVEAGYAESIAGVEAFKARLVGEGFIL